MKTSRIEAALFAAARKGLPQRTVAPRIGASQTRVRVAASKMYRRLGIRNYTHLVHILSAEGR